MKNNKGFSLIELLVVISILGILSSVAYVRFNKKKHIVKSDTMKLYTINSRAKNEAVKRNKTLYVGITEKDVDFYEYDKVVTINADDNDESNDEDYIQTKLIGTHSLDYFGIYTDSVSGDLLGKNPEEYDKINCDTANPKPSNRYDSCNGNMTCIAEEKKKCDSDKQLLITGKEYDYVYSFNHLGITEQEIELKLQVDDKFINVININFIGIIKTVLDYNGNF